MKKVFITLALVATSLAVPAVAANPQFMGVGPAVAGSVEMSQVPEAVRGFIQKHYPSATVVRIEKEFDTGNYDVDLSDGTDIDFNSKGKVIDIEAPDKAVLPESVLKAVLPAKTVEHLRKSGYLTSVDEISYKGARGYKVSLSRQTPDEIVYDVEGTFVMFDD